MRLLASTGEIVRGRCKSTNLCDYCATLGAVENSELLALDALHGVAPTVYVVLTTRTATLDMARFYESRRQVWRAIKRRWPAAELATLLEYSTGRGDRSGGQRRPHWNLLLKGVPAEAIDQLRADVVEGVWCAREDAGIEGQWVGAIASTGGLMKYLALHFRKNDQSPPAGWRGHRFSTTRGYLWTDTPAAREQARESLRRGRALHAAERRGLTGQAALDAAAWALELAAATTWSVTHVQLTTPTMRAPHVGPAGIGACRIQPARGPEDGHLARDQADAGSIPAAPIELEAGCLPAQEPLDGLLRARAAP